jgi:hypothetical protein
MVLQPSPFLQGRLDLTSSGEKPGPASVESDVWISENWYQRQIEVTEESWDLEGYDSVLTTDRNLVFWRPHVLSAARVSW